MIETNAERLKRYRAEAAQRGDCYVCRARPSKPGRRLCQECIDRSRTWKLGNLEAGLCLCGRERSGGGLSCQRCATKRSLNKIAMRVRDQAIGLCTRCRQVESAEGKTQCTGCLEEMRKGQLARTAALKGRPIAARHCTVCGAARSQPHHVRPPERSLALS